MTKAKREVYEVLISNMIGWVRCSVAKPQPSGWLHYELRDGTNGIAPPVKWRPDPARPGLGEVDDDVSE